MAGLCSKSHLVSGYVYPPTSTSAKEWVFKSYLYFCIGLSRSYSNLINFFCVTFGRVGTLNPTIFDIEPESTQKNSFHVTVKNSELNIKSLVCPISFLLNYFLKIFKSNILLIPEETSI